MTNLMAKKYHVFIGSTLDDLKNERRILPRIVMELGHIPVTVDCFDMSNGNDQLLIKKNLEECDYYLALIAHKLGPQGAKSSLETECAWAVKKGVPVIALIIDEKARWKAAKKEQEPEARQKLEDFKKKLADHTHETWLNASDLGQKAQSLLIQEMNLNPRAGWICAAQAIDPSVANELSRLSVENEDLKQQIRLNSGDIGGKIREQMKQVLKLMALNKVFLSFYYSGGDNWENTRQFRYLRIFKLLAPELSLGKTPGEISRFLGNVLNPDLEKTVRKNYPTPSNTIKKLMADFALLKLVKHSGQGDNEVWKITEYGEEVFSAYRMRQMERTFTKNARGK
ncbi:MAG: DUF4062 domain-containing protein [Treponema sp.]|jgi:hypothetical protein|nr:DUF4062 domain-containing protein [Treponema sp.]